MASSWACHHHHQGVHSLSEADLLLDAVAMSGAEQLLIPAMPGIGGAASDVTVVGFGKSVHVFSSKQAPKKLTIFGSDFASHDW